MDKHRLRCAGRHRAAARRPLQPNAFHRSAVARAEFADHRHRVRLLRSLRPHRCPRQPHRGRRRRRRHVLPVHAVDGAWPRSRTPTPTSSPPPRRWAPTPSSSSCSCACRCSRPGIVTGALVVFVLSITDFVVSQVLTNYRQPDAAGLRVFRPARRHLPRSRRGVCVLHRRGGAGVRGGAASRQGRKVPVPHMTDLRAAIVGTGFMGRVHAEALGRIGVSVVGVVGSTPQRAASSGLAPAYGSFDEMLRRPRGSRAHLQPERSTFRAREGGAACRQARHLRETARADIGAGPRTLCDRS